MRKIIWTLLFICPLVANAQSIDERIAHAMNTSDWIALDSIYNKAPKDSIWDFLEVYSRCLIGNRLNRPDVSIPAFAELLQTHAQELDLSNLFSSSMLYAMDLSKTGKNKAAAEILTKVLDAIKPDLDSENASVLQNHIDLYGSLSNYTPYSLTFQDETATIPFSVIRNEIDQARFKLDSCTVNGIDADITFDTGAYVNVISPEMAEKYRLIPLNASVIAGGMANVTGQYVIAKEMKLGNLTVTDVPFVILPFETGNAEADAFMAHYGIIIGVPFMLQIKDFTIDFMDHEILIPSKVPERSDQKPNMYFGDGQTFCVNGSVFDEPYSMHIDTGDADYGSLGFPFYETNKEFVETHGRSERIRRAGAGGVYQSEVYLVSDIPVTLGGNTVVPSELIVEKEELSHISALRFECAIGLKTLMLFGKVRFNMVDFVLSTELR